MIRRLASFVALAVALTAVLATAEEVAAPEPRAPVAEDLAWLAGCWVPDDGEPGSGERWTPPGGGTLLGVSRTVKGGETVFHEFLLIREVPGGLDYVASPSGQATTTFHATDSTGSAIVFENPEHDFPQRILYRRDGDRLLARIEGTTEKGERGVDFPMTRVACEPEEDGD